MACSSKPASMSIEEILDALHRKIAETAGEQAEETLQRLGSQPRFRRLAALILEQAEKADARTKTKARQQAAAAPPRPAATTLQEPPPSGALAPTPPSKLSPVRTLAVIHSDHHRKHKSAAFPEESPGRVDALLTHLRTKGFLEGGRVLVEAPLATVEQLTTVHTPEYVEFVRKTAKRGPIVLPRSTYLCPGSWQAVLAAAGAALAAGNLVEEEYDAAFALTRPPGQHALPDMYGGYCLFNNSALLARSLEERGSVMILNLDAHASNGSKRIFYSDPQVLTISIHHDPTHFFPLEGFTEEIGTGAGQGCAVNVPMPPGSSDQDYLRVFDEIVAPIHHQFLPKYLIVECGFDAHYRDPLGRLGLSSEAYYLLGQRLISLQNRRLVLTLEGGYNTHTIGPLAYNLLSSLVGLPYAGERVEAPTKGPSDPLSFGLVQPSAESQEGPRAMALSVDEVLDDLKRHLEPHWGL